MELRVDAERLRADFDALAEIGWTPGVGLSRIALSPAHLQARAWFLGRAHAAGLRTQVDSAANHSARLEAGDPAARTILLGSHLDSVPNGGRYDGALGVICALEVLRAISDAGLKLPFALEAIDFTDEEGTLVGTLGSWALTGKLRRDVLAAPRGGREHLLAELERAGLSEDGLLAAQREPESLAAFLELHVEQGPVLEQERVDIGIVTGIRGNASFDVIFSGEARHAGTTPMELRRDAALGAAAMTMAVRETVLDAFPRCVANVGQLSLSPGAYNVVPARARLGIECRSLDADELDRLVQAVQERARQLAADWHLAVEIVPVGRWDPVSTDPDVRGAIRTAANSLGLSATEIPSGAGHDAQVLAAVVPSGMIFVPSTRGISHDPEEFTSWEACVSGANVLLRATVELAHTLTHEPQTVQ